ncbi:hypothetical protein F0562_028575 [Nyssa sinensis]|uniref:HhH-GPD domain-containing protein n=1 Tax=Nyssa sinensis TaxID=561372 RepID=A0A5J5B2T7_9ASTE|nr:hypothetical protein F0562_028575 [Nyssa sinensis]
MAEQTLTLTLITTPSSSSPNPSQLPRKKSRKHSSSASAHTSTVTTATATEAKYSAQLVKTLSCDGEVDFAIEQLKRSDPKLVPIIEATRPTAGTTIYNRFVSLCGGEARVCPIAVLALTPPQLVQIGISARKASFLHDLANKYRTGILSDSKIVTMEDKALVSLITMVKGFGAMSVHMFMIFTLHRPDVLPFNDVNVRKGVQILDGLDQLPRPSHMEALCKRWRPYRSVASWYMWRLVEAKAGGGLPKQFQPAGGFTFRRRLC